MTNNIKYILELHPFSENKDPFSLEVHFYTLFNDLNEAIQEKEDLRFSYFDFSYEETKLNYSLWKNVPFFKFLQILNCPIDPGATIKLKYHKHERHTSDYSLPLCSSSNFKSQSLRNYSRSDNNNFVGLINSGNTCYLNSLLQGLFMTPEFRNEIYHWELDEDSRESMELSIPYQLQKIFCRLQFSTKYSIDTTGLTKSFRWVDENILEQQDIHELCRIMFDALEKKLMRNKERIRKISEGKEAIKSQNSMHIGTPTRSINMEKNPSCFINRYFGGKRASYVKCNTCQNFSFNDEDILDIQVPLSTFETDSKIINNLVEAFEMMEREETLDKENLYFCEKCQIMTEAKKACIFTEMPYILSLQLLRFTFNLTDFSKIKLQHRFEFPLDKFDCSKFVRSKNDLIKPQPETQQSQQDSGINSRNSLNDLTNEQDYIDNIFPVDTPDFTQDKPSSQKSDQNLLEKDGEGQHVYQLFSIMIHSGTVNKGHYYSYIRNFEDGEWYSFNDQNVTKISQEKIEETFGSEDTSRSAYFLWYRRIDVEMNQDFLKEAEFKPHMTEMVESIRREEEIENKIIEYKNSSTSVSVWFKTRTHNIDVYRDDTLSNSAILIAKKLDTYSDEMKYRLILTDSNSKIIASPEEIWRQLQSTTEESQDISMAGDMDKISSHENVTVRQALLLWKDAKFILEEREKDKDWEDYNENGYTFRIIPLSKEITQTKTFPIQKYTDLEAYQIGHLWSNRKATFIQLFLSIFQYYPSKSDEKIKGVINTLPVTRSPSRNLIDLSKCPHPLEEVLPPPEQHQPINIYIYQVDSDHLSEDIIDLNVSFLVNSFHHMTHEVFHYPLESQFQAQLQTLKTDLAIERQEESNSDVHDMSLVHEGIEVMDVDETTAYSYTLEDGLDSLLKLYKNNKLFFEQRTQEDLNCVKIVYPKEKNLKRAFCDFFMNKYDVEQNIMDKINVNCDSSNHITFEFPYTKVKVVVIDNNLMFRSRSIKQNIALNDPNLSVTDYYRRQNFIWPNLLKFSIPRPFSEQSVIQQAKSLIQKTIGYEFPELCQFHLKQGNLPTSYYLDLYRDTGKYSIRLQQFIWEDYRFFNGKTISCDNLDDLKNHVITDINGCNKEEDCKLYMTSLDFPCLIHSQNVPLPNEKESLIDLRWHLMEDFNSFDFEEASEKDICLLFTWFKPGVARKQVSAEKIREETAVLKYCFKLLNSPIPNACKYP